MNNEPSKLINTKETFGVACNFEVFGFDNISEHVPEIDLSYRFDPVTTTSILAGFANRLEFQNAMLGPINCSTMSRISVFRA